MAQKKKTNITLDTNSWMSTYTDLMILLLTFFVLLLSLSTVDKRRKRLALNSLVGAFGFKPGGQSILGQAKGMNITTTSAPLVEEEVQFERLRNVALKHGLKSELSMSKQLERTVLILNNQVLFDTESAVLKEENREYLADLAEAIIDGPRLIELRGYVDSSECVMADDPYKTSMLLSSKRVVALFDFFIKQGVPPERIVAHGFGLNYPGKVKGSKESYLNRQVEIILDYRESVPFHLKKPARRKGLLDFNGFIFRTLGDKDGR